MSKEIELTDEQKAVLKKQLDGEFSPFLSSESDKETLKEVIEMAESLVDELDAYDEMGDDLMQWFWDKYQKQCG